MNDQETNELGEFFAIGDLTGEKGAGDTMQYTNCELCKRNEKECSIKEDFLKAAEDLRKNKSNGYLELNCINFTSNLTLAKNLIDNIIAEKQLNPTQSEVREAIIAMAEKLENIDKTYTFKDTIVL